MSEGSLPPFGVPRPRSVPGTVGRALGRIFGRARRKVSRQSPSEPAPPDRALENRAADAIRRHAEANAALFERAERLTEKAGRLERAGTPSDSAGNRAARARGEVEAGLVAVREAFVESEGRMGGRAFDEATERLYPGLGFNASGPGA